MTGRSSRRRWSFVLGLTLVGCLIAPVRADTTVSAGSASLTVSQSTGLDPAGVDLEVRGAGFDERKGIYVAFCVVNATGVAPGPCGGGIDTEGTSGSSVWISSDPPPYGEGLAVPYGPGGAFSVRIRVTGVIGANVDCASVTCAVVTRNDHTRSSDRGQDLAVALSFRAPDRPATIPPIALVIPLSGLAILGIAAVRRRRRAELAHSAFDP